MDVREVLGCTFEILVCSFEIVLCPFEILGCAILKWKVLVYSLNIQK
jgi:hypothetical protein